VSRIRRLPDHVVNKIAAGEVVERPASVVKELVENALDAGARTVRVDLREGGAALVRVADDGAGMTAEELDLALERHATSKIADEADLLAVGTLGFRGEALPAICAVSRFTITSRVAAAPEGARVTGAGGVVTQRLRVPAAPGTTVEVAELFFNTPARLRFLKAPSTELAASLRALTHLAVAHPAVHLHATHDGRVVLTAPPARELRERLGALWGWEVAGRLLVVRRAEQGLAVEGLAGPPTLTRGAREDVLLVVNGRPVRDPALLQAVLDAYRPLLPRDRFPVAALHLTLPAADVDVNVHPTKAWVRFRQPRLVQALVAEALAQVLRQPVVVPRLAPGDGGTAPGAAAAEAARAPAVAAAPAATGPGGLALGVGDAPGALVAEPTLPYATRAPGATAFGRVLGQVQGTFVVAASDDEVFFVDQHAAHERVLAERLEADLARGRPLGQALLFPEPLPLAPPARVLLERWRAPLEALGFAFEGFGGDAVVLRAVPTLLQGEEPRRLLEAVVAELGGPRAGAAVVERVLAFVACRAAVKAGVPLAQEAMERLLAELAATRTPYFCPHGRPTMSRLALADVRREVRRRW